MSNSFSDIAGRMTGTAQPDAVSGQQFVGKYRGTVVNNIDPLRENRIQAIVPDVSSIIPTSWAVPCMPPGHSFTPRIGAGVWIEFEQGDPDYPIWTGCFPGSALPIDLPVASQLTPPGVPQTTIGTPLQHSISVSDSPTTGIMMRTPGTAMISVTDAGGIIITNGVATITMQGPNITLAGNVVVI
jgi:hypothetical protein